MCDPHAARSASAVIASAEFLSVYDSESTTTTGRARLLDGSVSRGPFSFWRRVPVLTDAHDSRMPLFAMPDPDTFPTALAIDLLLLPPVDGEGDLTVCTACDARRGEQQPLLPGDRHFVACPHGMRAGVAHDQAVQALTACLDALLGAPAVIAERAGPRGHQAMTEFMSGPGLPLYHRPDIVVRGYDGTGTFLLIDCKTLDAAGATHVATHHTDRTRLAAHTAIAQTCRTTEYRDTFPQGMRLVVVAISTFGSFGTEAQRLFAELSHRSGGGVPYALLDEASWAAPRFAPFIRMALGCAVRRGLAQSVRRHWRRVPRPPPPPLIIPVPLRPPPPLHLGPQRAAEADAEGPAGAGPVLPPLAEQVPMPIPGLG